MSAINWQPSCCVHHGDYAEHKTHDGGIARIKRAPGSALWHVCRFGADNRAIDTDADGVPAYVEMAEAEALALLA